jgi:CRP-like cAMP-binding protein
MKTSKMEYSKGQSEACPMREDLEKVIGGHPFLKGLTPHHLRLLSDCAMKTTFNAGELIFREGDPANRFYLITKGEVAIECPGGEKGSARISVVKEGEVLGWSWLFSPFYWNFDARAITTAEAIFFYGTPLRAECESDHDLGYELLKRMSEVMMRRLQATRRQLLDLRFK